MLLINNKIKNYISEKRISKDALGVMSGIAKSTIHGIVNGKTEVKIEQLIKISNGLHISPCFWFEDFATNVVNEPSPAYGLAAQIELLKDQLKDKERLIARLEKEIERYERSANDKGDLIMAANNGNYETPRMSQ